jgi:hypothetical protein
MIRTLTHNTMAATAGVGRVRAASDHGYGLMTWSASVPSFCLGNMIFAGNPQNETTKRSTRRLGKRPT